MKEHHIVMTGSTHKYSAAGVEGRLARCSGWGALARGLGVHASVCFLGLRLGPRAARRSLPHARPVSQGAAAGAVTGCWASQPRR